MVSPMIHFGNMSSNGRGRGRGRGGNSSSANSSSSSSHHRSNTVGSFVSNENNVDNNDRMRMSEQQLLPLPPELPTITTTTGTNTTTTSTTTTTTMTTAITTINQSHDPSKIVQHPTTTTTTTTNTMELNPDIHTNNTTNNVHDNGVIDDDDDCDSSSSSSSSSSSDDSSVLSDTGCIATTIRRKYTHHSTMIRTIRRNNNNNNNNRTTATSTSSSSPPRSSSVTSPSDVSFSVVSNIHHDDPTHHNNNTWMQQQRLFQNIEDKLRRQFHYRDQIYHHLLSIHHNQQQQQQSKMMMMMYQRFVPFFYHTNNNSTSSSSSSIYLQSILDREYQVRHCTIDRILYKLQQQQQGRHTNTHQIDNCINEEEDGDDDIEQLRQRLYQMVAVQSLSTVTAAASISQETVHPLRNETNDMSSLQKNLTQQQQRGRYREWCGMIKAMVVNTINHLSHNDDLLFVRHLFVPATLSLLIHCMVHTSLYDGIAAILVTCKSYLLSGSNDVALLMDVLWSCMVFSFGLLLLRGTGDIFWWSSSSDYKLIKFDFHNRRQIMFNRQREALVAKNTADPNGDCSRIRKYIRTCCTMTQITLWIRQRPVLRAIFFMVGYTCCYIASYDFLRYMTQLVLHCYNHTYLYGNTYQNNWYHHILSNLPSIVEMERNGICLSQRNIEESFCSWTCQNELEYRTDQFLLWKSADMEYTRNQLSSESYDQYWSYWIHHVDMTAIADYHYPGSVVVNYHLVNDTNQLSNGKEDGYSYELRWNNDLPPLFLKHEQILYCCFVILASVGILTMNGVKLWEKY